MVCGPNPDVSVLLIDAGADAAPDRSVGESAARTFDERSLAGLLRAVVARRSDAPAISTGRATWSYRQLFAASESIAANLAADPDFHPGDRIVLLAPNSPEYVASFYGVVSAGGVIVPIPPKIEPGALQSIVTSTEARHLIATPQVLRSRADLDDLTTERLDLSVAPISQPRTKSGAGDELAAIFFTAGSTGTPRGVMLSHANLIANARSIQAYLRIDETDRPLCVLPLHHAFGNSVLQSHLLAGAHLVLDGQAVFPETIVTSLRRHSATSLSGVPELYQLLLERSSLGHEPLPELRYMAVAGGALRRDLALEVGRRISPAEFFVMYGQTEATARLAYVPPQRLADVSAGCIGRAVPGVTLEVAGEDGAPLPPGEIGELRARGPNVMLGYWRDPEATAERVRDGWLYTGDLALRDADGWVYHKGRQSALVKIAGYRVHPADLEDFAVRRLGVAQAAAVPCEFPLLGARLALFVVGPPGATSLTLSEMIARCRAELPRHLVPEFIETLESLPLNHALKIDRPLLAQIAQRKAARYRAPA